MARPISDVRRTPTSDVIVHVGNSVNGVEYAVPLASSDLVVEELREALATLSDIPAADQILLGGPPYARLDPRRALSSYGLPSADKRVFLYDRRMLSQEHPILPRVALAPVEVELPTAPVSSSASSRLLNESTSPMLRALGEYESHFQLQVDQSEALTAGSEANVAAAERAVAELVIQSDAIGAAIANLDTFRAAMHKHFTPFWTEYEDASTRHENLLQRFESYLAALQTVPLHTALVTPERKTLLDCIPVDREREWAQQCEESHAHMRAQVARLKQVHDEIYEQVGLLVRARDEIGAAHREALADVTRMKHHIASQRAITATLSGNLELVMARIAETSSEIRPGQMFASTHALDLCRGIDELYHQQMNLLPQAQSIADEIKTSMSKLSSTKLSFFTRVHSHLVRISVWQSKIRDFEHSLAMLKEALSAQKKHFNELEHLERLPESYAACLKEITRRVRYGRQFADRIQSMAEELAQLRDEEVHHREVFLKKYGQHLPRDFVPGLAEKPSHCEFRMRPFDQNLPQIEENDGDDEETADRGVVATSRGPDSSFEEGKEEFFETRQSLGSEPSTQFIDAEQHIGGDAEGTAALEVELLQNRCDELEATVARLTAELERAKKGSFYDSGSCGSIARSDLSKTSEKLGDSFPLVLALAATTAGGMTSSSEAERSNLLERELQSLKHVKAEAETVGREKDRLIAKLESENQQYLLNATAFEEEIQVRSRREKQLVENQTKLQQSIQSLESNAEAQRTALLKILKLLGLAPARERDVADWDTFVETQMERIETRIRDLLASSDTERVLREELEQRHDEINMLESQHFEVTNANAFKISFRSFEVNDLALFLPTSAPGSDAQRVYLAFHHGCPHRFLSEESISSFMIGGRKYPDYVVGRIVFVDEQVANEGNNPYGLHLGTTFYVMTVASLQDT